MHHFVFVSGGSCALLGRLDEANGVCTPVPLPALKRVEQPIQAITWMDHELLPAGMAMASWRVGCGAGTFLFC